MAETGFQSATGWRAAGRVAVGTKAEERKVTGKSQIRPALWATSTLRAVRPMVAPTQDMAKAKRRMRR